MKLRILLLLAITGSVACHREPGGTPAAPAKPKPGVQASAPAARPANPQQLTAGMVDAVAQGKGQAPIDVKFDLLERPVRGQPLEIAIALLPLAAARSATVAVTAPDGLKLDPGEAQFEFPAVEPLQVYRHSIKLTPATEGLYLLTLSVSLQHDQTSDAHVFSVPILVGNAAGTGPAAAGRGI